jgi:hypothetical protein
MKTLSCIAVALAVALAAGPVAAQNKVIDVNKAIADLLKKKGEDKKIYKKLFGQNMPAGAALSAVRLRGKLIGAGITYEKQAVPNTPVVGDSADIRNCSTNAVERPVSYTTTQVDTSEWSTGTTFSAGFTQSVEVSASFSAPFVDVSAKSTSTWNMDRSDTSARGGSISKERQYSQGATVFAAPNRLTKTQLIVFAEEAKGIEFTAKLIASGTLDVAFSGKEKVDYIEIVGEGANKCLDVSQHKKSSAGAPQIYIWSCNGWNNQKWTMTGSGQIKNLTGKCLDIEGSKGNRGDNVHAWDCHGGDNQKWKWSGTQIKGKNNRCLDVGGRHTGDGSNVIVWDCHNDSNQKWKKGKTKAVNVTRERTGTVRLEDHLSAADRHLVLNGVFTGTFNSNKTDIWVLDKDISKECEAERQKLFGTAQSKGPAGAVGTKSVPGKAPAAQGAAQSSLVKVIKPTAKPVKGTKPLSGAKSIIKK